MNSDRASGSAPGITCTFSPTRRSADMVYIANVDFYKSIDGGHTFNKVKVPHGDNHGMWIDPHNPKRMIDSNDGGVTVTVDGGKNWTRQDNQPTAQFYHVITDKRSPYYVYGSQQDLVRPWRLPAAATMARSSARTGTAVAAARLATSRRIRRIQISCMRASIKA